MYRHMFKSKVYKAVVTEANLNYNGAITINEELMKESQILKTEKVQIVNINNGERFETYDLNGEKNSRIICLNGEPARCIQVGDRVIMQYGIYDKIDIECHSPKIICVNGKNEIDG